MTLDEIVSSYISEYRTLARAETRSFEKESTLRDVIRRAALCLWPNWKRHEHQYRIPKPLLEQAEGRLQGIARKLEQAADFAALYDLLESEIGSIHGIGELTVYDIAHRIGAYLKKAPSWFTCTEAQGWELLCLDFEVAPLTRNSCRRLSRV